MHNSPQTQREASEKALAMRQETDEANAAASAPIRGFSGDDVDPLLTTQQVCELLGIGRTSLYRLLENGSLAPPLKIGVCNRWPLSEVRAFIDRAKQARAAEAEAA